MLVILYFYMFSSFYGVFTILILKNFKYFLYVWQPKIAYPLSVYHHFLLLPFFFSIFLLLLLLFFFPFSFFFSGSQIKNHYLLLLAYQNFTNISFMVLSFFFFFMSVCLYLSLTNMNYYHIDLIILRCCIRSVSLH